MIEDAAVHIMLNALTLTQVSLHSVDAPAGGSDEITGGDYARLDKAFAGPAANRKRLIESDAVFNLDAGHTPKSIGFWGGETFLGYIKLAVQPDIAVNDTTYTCPAAETGLTF
jgi:hypothetical protein